MRSLLKERPVPIVLGLSLLILNLVQLAYLSAGNHLPLVIPVCVVCVSVTFCAVAVWMAYSSSRGESDGLRHSG